jgi:Cys-tRNA(Pro)/Cys-tRNA(Cys) deacylase
LSEYETRVRRFMEENGVDGAHLSFDESCHSVEEAARTVGAEPEEFVKSICMLDFRGKVIVAIVKGEDRASTTRVGRALGFPRPRVASPEEMLDKTGYPAGGTPPFGFDAVFLVDPRVMEMDEVYAGGGSECSLVRVPVGELLRVNDGRVIRVRR